MVNTVPILEIPIDDSQWQAFLETFNKFKVDAAEIPNSMAEIDRVIERMPEHLRPGAEALEDAAAVAADVLDSSGAAGGKKPKSGGRKREAVLALDWVLANTGARRFASTIGGATRDLARWEKLTAVFAGLLGAGGLFGLDMLAARASQRRQEASGYGVSTGQLAAFQTNFGRLGDTSGILAGLNRAETDFAQRQPVASLGIDTRGKNSFALFAEMLPKLKTLADHANPSTFKTTIESHGLQNIGITVETMRALRAMDPAEIADMQAGARRDADPMNIPDDIGAKWQELTTGLEKAGAAMQTKLADRLVALTPSLEHLSATATDLLNRMLASQNVKDWLKKANDGLLGFANTVGSDNAQANVKNFLHHFDMAQRDFDSLNQWFERHGDHVKEVFAVAVGMRAGRWFGPAGIIAGGFTGLMFSHSSEGMIGGAKPSTPQGYGDGDLPGVGPSFNYNPNGGLGSGGETKYDVTPADPSKPVPPLNLKGNPFAHPDVDDVDPRLREILAAGQTHLPAGYTMRVTSGYDATHGDVGSQHRIKGRGALDVVIFGPDGKPIGNQGDEPITGPYHTLARASYGEMLARHPELNKTFGWGGGFDSGRGDVRQDLMHFDLGGERASRYPENAMSRMGPLPEQLRKKEEPAKEQTMPQDAARPPAQDKTSMLAPHPDARPRAPQSLVVQDNSGGSVTTTMAV